VVASVNTRGLPWAQVDLARRLCGALDLAKNAIEQLAPGGYEDREEPANNLRPEKVISESGLLLLAASTAAQHPGVGDRLRTVAERLAPHARSERMLLGICMEPALAWDYAQAHICLTRLGYPAPRFDAVLEMIGKSQARRGRERPPHRTLEQIRVMRGLRTPPPRAKGTVRQAPPIVIRDSVLGQPMDLLCGSREDIYAFTHAVMFVTDFNIRPWRLPRRRSVILAEAEAALARCLDDHDYDLAGEVLLTWPLTGRSWAPVAAFGFRVLAQVEDQAGFLPSASIRPERLEALHGDDRKKYLLATAYHTAYVMGLLCAAALQPGRAPPTAIKAEGSTPGRSRLVLAKLDADTQRTHWREGLSKLSEAERDTLASMLLTIGLRRSVVQRDFIRLHEFLQIGRAAGLTDMPSASQAAELLARLAFVSDIPAQPQPQPMSAGVGHTIMTPAGASVDKKRRVL